MQWEPITILLKDEYGNVYGAIREDADVMPEFHLYVWEHSRLVERGTSKDLDTAKRIVMALACGQPWPVNEKGVMI